MKQVTIPIEDFPDLVKRILIDYNITFEDANTNHGPDGLHYVQKAENRSVWGDYEVEDMTVKIDGDKDSFWDYVPRP